MSVVSSRFTFQALPPNNSLDFKFFQWLDGCHRRVRCFDGQQRVQFRVDPVHLCGAEIRRSSVLHHIVLVDFIGLSRYPLPVVQQISRPLL